MGNNDRKLVEPLTKKFSFLSLEDLPHALVHGDIIKTNVMKNTEGELYIIDFSVANYYPRIQELAVMLCSTFFDEEDAKHTREYYNLALSEYQKYIQLTSEEMDSLPLFVQVAHAMHILGGTKEKVEDGETSEENEYWINLGRAGLLQ